MQKTASKNSRRLLLKIFVLVVMAKKESQNRVVRQTGKK